MLFRSGALTRLRDAMAEMECTGFDTLKAQQWALGRAVRAMLEGRGIRPVAAPGFQAPGVVVSHTDNPAIQNGSAFIAQGLQTAAGVPLQCGEGASFKTFRLGLFGLDKLANVERTVASLSAALDRIG